MEKEVKHHTRIWTRASVRWKEGAVLSARRRRKSVYRRSSSASRSAAEDSRSSSIAPSRRSSLSTPPESTIPPPPVLVPPDSRRNSIAGPPAYHQPPRLDLLTAGKAPSLHNAASNSHISAHYEHSISSGENTASPVLSVAGHVATDDKARLAHLASLASAPELPGHHREQSSAPEWHDEEPQDGPSSPYSEELPPQPHSFLPLPPEKPYPIPETAYGNDTFNVVPLHDDRSTLHLQPSAPPFEESHAANAPSAPELDDVYIASAPPLEYDQGDELGHAGDTPQLVTEAETGLGQDHDRHTGPPEYPI